MGTPSKKSRGKKLEMKNPMRDSARDSELGQYFTQNSTFEGSDNVIDIPAVGVVHYCADEAIPACRASVLEFSVADPLPIDCDLVCA